MNILTDALPDFVSVNGVKYSVLTDFRIWLEFGRIMHHSDISAKDKTMMILSLCIDGEKNRVLPQDVQDVMDALCGFYLCGNKKKDGEAGKTERGIDFTCDSIYIYSAFLTQYGIDLLSIPYMHWYAFYALFEGLEDSRKIVKIMKFRLSRPENEQNAEKRKYLKRMKEIYALPDLRSKREREEDIADILFKVF